MGIPIGEVIAHELLSEEVIDCIPHECEVCGSEIEFTDSLKQIYCPNRFCALKVAARLEAMAKHMKADGWGASTCREVCITFKLRSPYQVFLLEKAVAEGRTCENVSGFAKKVASICDRTKRRIKLWEVVKYAGIPSIENIAYKIFDGYENLKAAFDDIERMQVPFIAERLGLKNSDTGVLAVNVYNTLMEYRDEMYFGETCFEIYQPTGETMYIAITGGVNGWGNKSEFIRFINNRYKGQLNAMLMNSVTSQVHALVADGDTSSNKYRTACRLREKGSNILITDSLGLLQWLDTHFKSAQY